MKELSYIELMELFEEAQRPKLHEALELPGTQGLVVFENLQLDSSWCGMRTALAYGPGRTHKRPEEVAKGHLYDLPSHRQYPVAIYRRQGAMNA